MNLKMLWDMVSLAAGPVSDLYKSIDNHVKAKQNAKIDRLKRDLYWLNLGFSNRSRLQEVPDDGQETYASLAASSHIINDHFKTFRNQPEYEFMPPEMISINDAFSSSQVYMDSIRRMREYNFWDLPKVRQLAYLIYYRGEVTKFTNYKYEEYVGRLAYETRDLWMER